MRRISPILTVLLVLCLLEGHVLGYASAPGTYPDEEMKAGSDMEVPKNPYQNGWTGYDFYYEKEPKAPTPGGSGQMPAFQSIEEVSSDRESPEDPGSQVYQATGSESGAKNRTPVTTSKPVAADDSSVKVMVSPSSSTKDISLTSTTTTTTTIAPSTSVEDTEPSAPTPAPAKSASVNPESGSDQSAADQLELLYGGEGAKEDKEGMNKDPVITTVSTITTITANPTPRPSPSSSHHDPPPPAPALAQNLLTTLIEKKRTRPDDSAVDPSSGYGDSGAGDTHESGYGLGDTRSSKWGGKGRAPGTEPKLSSYDNSPESSGKPGTEPTTRGSESEYDQNSIGNPVTTSSGDSGYGTSAKSADVKSASPERSSYESISSPSSKASSNPYAEARTTPSSSPKFSEGPRSTDFGIYESAKVPGHSPSTSRPSSPNLLETTYLTYSNPSPTNGPAPSIPEAHGFGFHGKSKLPESQTDYGSDAVPPSTPSSSYRNPIEPSSSSYNNPGHAPGSGPRVRETSDSGYPAPQTDVLDYGARPNNHIGKVPKTSNFVRQPPTDDSWNYSNSNNAISPRDPYDHFGSAHHPAPSPPSRSTSSSSTSSQKHFTRGNFEEDPNDVYDGGYDGNDVVIVPLRSASSPSSTASTSNTEVRAQISEIDRIAESFENSAREPVEYEHKITSESSKGITVEAGKAIQKHLGRKARKCCSCCDQKQPVSRNIETKVAPLHVQQAVDPSRQLGENDPVESYQPLQSTVGGSAYVQQPPVAPPPPQQTYYQQPFQQYQPQYPQSYPYQQQSCGCQPQPQNCCAPPAPCCLPTIPCCPPIPCCPQPKICCQPTPICLPPQQCCSINFKLPTIPICGRACPSCPCRRRVHKSRRLKRHAISSNCHQCSSDGEPWKAVLHQHRHKRAAPGCSSGFSTMQQNSCGTCGASHLRSTRVKRMGCLPCLGRKKRDTEENSHIRVKRMGCLPCLNGGRKKRSALSPSSGCSRCNSLGHLFNRYKRSLFGCSPCAPQPPCGCQGRKKRSVSVKIIKRAPEQCDATCCDYSKCLNRQKKETLVPFM